MVTWRAAAGCFSSLVGWWPTLPMASSNSVRRPPIELTKIAVTEARVTVIYIQDPMSALATGSLAIFVWDMLDAAVNCSRVVCCTETTGALISTGKVPEPGP